MTYWYLIWRELRVRRATTTIAILAVALAVSAVIGASTVLRGHLVQTTVLLHERQSKLDAQLAKLEDDYRKIMLKLGFNLLIYPEAQSVTDLYDKNYVSAYMPEAYVDMLANANLMSVQHLLPILQAKVEWTEQHRMILLTGTRGEVDISGGKKKKPMLEAVGAGTIALGHDLHASRSLQPGDTVTLLGHTFTVSRVNPERGNQDDVTAWIDLQQAQTLLHKEGQISAIFALECVCNSEGLATIRQDVGHLLPATRVIEFDSQAVARAEARRYAAETAAAEMTAEKAHQEAIYRERLRFISLFVPLVVAGSLLWVALLAYANVRERRYEIGFLRALGIPRARIVVIFLGRALTLGVLGTVVGSLIGMGMGLWVARLGPSHLLQLVHWPLLIVTALITPLLSALVSIVPSWQAAQEDPAAMLAEE